VGHPIRGRYRRGSTLDLWRIGGGKKWKKGTGEGGKTANHEWEEKVLRPSGEVFGKTKEIFIKHETGGVVKFPYTY